MRIKTRFVFPLDFENAKKLFETLEIKFTDSSSQDTLRVIEIYKDSPKYDWVINELKKRDIICTPDEEPVFTKKELLSSPILRIVPNAHKGGYPQPENGGKEEDYQSFSYDLTTGCAYCTNGRIQNRPLRLVNIKMGASDISGIWWTRELIVTKRLKELIEANKLTGCEFWPVINHKNNIPFEDVYQLKIDGELPKMSSRTKTFYNNELVFNGQKLRSYPCKCGEKYIKGEIYYNSKDLLSVSDFMLTHEWFGVNGEFWRWPFLSQKAYRIFDSNNIKGVRFYPPVVLNNSI